MGANVRRVLRLVYSPETEWNRIVADPDAARSLRPTVALLLVASTVTVTLGYLVLRPVAAPVVFVPVYALMFAAGRLCAIALAWFFLRTRPDVPTGNATLLAGYGSVPILMAGLLEILPIPFMRWLWVLAGLGFAYMTLATAMAPVLGASSERGSRLTRVVSALLALPVVALDLLRHVCP